MHHKPWAFTTNPFQTSTKGSFINGFTMSTFLDSALNAAKADSAILTLYNYYHPVHSAYIQAYNNWFSQLGSQKGSTLSLQNLLDGLTAKVNAWDAAVQVVYAKDTPTYISLFQNGHKPFNANKQSERIAAVQSLDQALSAYAVLANVKTDVHNYALSLETTNTTQKGNKSTKNTLSDMLEEQRIAMCSAQMYCYGGLIQKFNNQLDRVGEFFDLQILRDSNQTFFAGQAAANHNTFIFKRTLDEAASIAFKNTGATPLKFYLSERKAGELPTIYLVLEGGNEQTFSLKDLGDVSTMHYLNVSNNTPFDGSFEVRIL